jgi:PPOX class probable F420-dependent enzyme
MWPGAARRANCSSVKPLPPQLDEFLTQANPSVIGTLDADGAPHTAATWYVWEDGRALVNMDATRKRLEHLRRDPRVSLTVIGRGDDWYRQVTLRGRVTTLEDDDDLSGIDRISQHYTGSPYARRDQQRVNGWIEVESWYGWDGGHPWR